MGAGDAGAHFTFTLKAPRRITHDNRLQRCADLLPPSPHRRPLGAELGALLFQLPPNFKKDARSSPRS